MQNELILHKAEESLLTNLVEHIIFTEKKQLMLAEKVAKQKNNVIYILIEVGMIQVQ